MRHPRFVAAAISLLFLLPCTVQAVPPIKVTNIVPGCQGSVPILTITLNSLTHSYFGNNLYYHFDPPSPGAQSGATTNPFVLQLPSFVAGSSHILWISNSAAATGGVSSAPYTFVAPSCGSGTSRKGMTWRLVSTNAPTGTVRVGCGHSSGLNECNAYQGDTPCTTALPLLCIRKTGAGFPLPPPASVDNTNNYNKWSDGVIGTTSAVVPATLAAVPPATLADANAECVQEFGADWRVAEFHDGWGWYFQAYGGVGDPSKRFWVHINDQPGARCWQ